MAGPGGAEVGRVHIRVVPDFTYFRKIMRAVLEEWDGKKIHWTVVADTSDVRKAAKDTVKAAKEVANNQARLNKKAASDAKKLADIQSGKNAGKGGAGGGPNLNAMLKQRMQNQLNQTMADLEVRLNTNKKKGGPDNTLLRAHWQKVADGAQKQIDKLDPLGDLGMFNAQASYVRAEMQRLRNESGNIWDTPEIRKKILESRAEMELLRNKTFEVQRDFMFAYANAQNAQNRIPTSGKDAGKTGLAAKLFDRQQAAAMREYLYGFRDIEGNVTRIGGRVDRLRMRGGIIGGLMGGVGAIAGAKAAFDALSDGMTKIGTTAVKAANETGGLMKSLIPSFGTGLNMAAYGVIIAGIVMLAAPLIGLLTAAALTLPGLLATVMAPIGAVVLGFKGIQKAAENAGLFADKNGDKKGGGSLGAALKELQTQVESVFETTLTEPFKKLGAVANSWVAPLTTVAQGTADIFKGMLDSITSEVGSTRIGETMSAIGTQLSASFAPGIKSFTDALIGLAHEFTAGGALEGVGKWFKDTMADFSAWVEKGKESGSLTRIFGELGDVMRILLESVGELAKSGLDFVKDPAAMDGFKNTLKDIVGLIERIGQISAQLGPLWDALDFFLPNRKEFNSEMDKMNADLEKQKGWKPGSINAAAAAQDANPNKWKFWEVGDPGAEAAQAGRDSAKAYTEGVAAALAQDKEAQAGFLRSALTGTSVSEAVAAQISGQASIAIDGARQALVPLQAGLQTDINNALQPLGDIAGKVQTAFAAVPAQVQTALSGVGGVVVSSLMNIATLVPGALFNLPNVIGNAFNPAVTAVQTTLGRMGQVAVEASGQVVQAIGISFTATAPAVEGAMAPAITSVGSILQQMVATALSFAGAMRSAGTSIGASFAQGLADSSGLVANSASALLGVARAFFPFSPAKKGPFSGAGWVDKSGESIGKGFATGIDNSQTGVVNSAKELMQAIKDVFGSAEGLNINFYMGGAQQAMSSMATSSKEFRTNMTEAGTTPQIAGSGVAATEEELANVARDKAELTLKIKELQAQKNATQDKNAKAALQSEIDQLNIQKSRLDLMKEEGKLQEERKTAIQQLSDSIATNIVDTIKMPGQFAKATTDAAMQDLGISGSGALPTIANWALDAGSKYIFNVSNMDDALAGQKRQQSRETLGVTG